TSRRSSVARARLEKFAPAGVDARPLELPAQVTRADLDAAIARVDRDQSAFSDPSALTAYLESQRELLEPLASPPAGDDRVISDVVPKRAKLPPAVAALPEAKRAIYEKAGLSPQQIAKAVSSGLGPR